MDRLKLKCGSCQIVSSKNESQDGLDTSCSPCKVHYRVHGSGTFLTRVAFVPIVHRPTPHAPGTRPAHASPTPVPHQILTPRELSYLRPLTILTPLKLFQLTFHIRLNRHIFSFSPNTLLLARFNSLMSLPILFIAFHFHSPMILFLNFLNFSPCNGFVI